MTGMWTRAQRWLRALSRRPIPAETGDPAEPRLARPEQSPGGASPRSAAPSPVQHVQLESDAEPAQEPQALTAAPVPARSLEDLPEHRREAMLWHHALQEGYDELDEYVRLAGTQPACQPPEGQRREDWRLAQAFMGDDGRYHLRLGSAVACGDRPPWEGRFELPPGSVEVPHAGWTRRLPDGDTRRPDQPPTPEQGARDFARVSWTVRLGGEPRNPALIPPAERCPVQAHHGLWPHYRHAKSGMGRVRRELIDELGPMCSGCGTAVGLEIDHDHFSGLVRGLLCRVCNNRIESCPHVSGCPWADYLNDPPAAHLGLLYPRRSRDRQNSRRKIEHLGLDPWDI